MRLLNARHLGRDEATDVLCYDYPDIPGLPGTGVAEIVLNVEQALRAARRARWDASRELALYLAHGFDHLAGANDASLRERRAMRRRELRWLRQAAREGRLERLIEKP